jgi:glycosyltransferase involved in cell wall biosynthesis
MNILFIPHVPNTTVINRVYEFAKNSNSYYLYWEIDNASLLTKINSQISSLKYEIDDKKVKIPLLFKPEKFAAKINTLILNKVIKKLKIDVVVNANALLFDIENIAVPVVYDLVDDHISENSDIGLNKARIEKIKKDIKVSKGVICVTEILEEKVKNLNKNTITIENGVYIDKFKKAKSLKKELSLENKKVFGFIGGIDEWTGIEKVIKEYLKMKNSSTEFLVVGGNNGEFYKNLVKKYDKDVLFVGRVSPNEVPNYFKTIDIGLIPFELNNFTNNALPIKALEYGLAGSYVISTPLKALKRKNFPFIEFCEIDKFHNCMKKDFDEVKYDFNSYDWKEQTKRVKNFIKRIIKGDS